MEEKRAGEGGERGLARREDKGGEGMERRREGREKRKGQGKGGSKRPWNVSNIQDHINPKLKRVPMSSPCKQHQS